MMGVVTLGAGPVCVRVKVLPEHFLFDILIGAKCWYSTVPIQLIGPTRSAPISSTGLLSESVAK